MIIYHYSHFSSITKAISHGILHFHQLAQARKQKPFKQLDAIPIECAGPDQIFISQARAIRFCFTTKSL